MIRAIPDALKKCLPFLFFFLPLAALPQDLHTLVFRPLNAQRGLIQSYNWYVYHDSQGYVWISSLSGLNRFDGFQVKQYNSVKDDSTSLLGETINSDFLEDSRQDIWFSTMEAVHCYRRNDDHFSRFFLFDDEGKKIGDEYQVHFLEQDTLLWVGANGAIYRWNTRRPRQPAQKVFETGQFRFRMMLDGNGAVRQIFAFGFLVGIELYPIKNGRLDGKPGGPYFKDDRIREVFPESDSLIWFSYDNRGLVAWNPTKKSEWRIWADLGAERYAFAPWNQEHLILAARGKGFFLVDKKNGSLRPIESRFNGGNENAGQSIKSLYLDRDGNLWAPDENIGLHYANLNKTKFRSLPKLPGIGANENYAYWALSEDLEGNVWIAASPGGVFVLDNNNRLIRRIVHEPGNDRSLPSNWAKDVLQDKNHKIWITTSEGLVWTQPGDQRFHQVAAAGGEKKIPFIQLHETRSGRLLVSSENQGIFEIRDQKDRVQLINLLPVSTGEYHTIFEDAAGKLYCIRNSKEVCVFQLQEDSIQLLDIFPIGGFVTGFFEDECSGDLFFGTSTGLVKLDQNGTTPIIYSEVNGLPGKFIGEMLADSEKNLWIGTNKGLAFFDRTRDSIRGFSPSDGVSSPEFHITAELKKSNGELWFGGSAGITIVPANGKFRNVETPPKVILTGIKINDETPDSIRCAETGATNISRIRRLVLPFKNNTLSFDFIAVEYSDPANNRLKYRLEGSDDHWVDIRHGEPGSARYSKLRPGNYTFWVRAANSDGVWNQPVAALYITIKPPWYLTWWFWTMVGLAFLWGIIRFYRFRVDQIRRKEEMLRKEAEFKQKEAEFRQREAEAKQQMAETETAILRLQMNPHFIFNSMNSINAYILKKDIDTASDYLGRFAQLMRMILNQAAKPFHTISDEIGLLEQYLNTEAMRFEKKFSYEFEIEPTIDPDEEIIPTMILQPFVENAIWHGLSEKKSQGRIRIGFSNEAGKLLCSVEDNGVGRNTRPAGKNGSAIHAPHAMSITARRLELLETEEGFKPSVEVIDLKNKEGHPEGTRILLRLPFM